MLKSIVALSFAILLPRILLIPVFVILLGLAMLALVLITLGLAVISPFIAVIVAVILGLSLAMIPIIIGIRLGFTARGHDVTGTYGGLVLPGAIYGAVEAVGYLFVTLSATVILVLISSTVPPAELLALLRAGGVEAIEGVLQTGTLPAGILAVISFLAASALRAAILVPLAGAASGRDANGSPHIPLAGFGTGFVPLTLLVCASYVLFPLLIMGFFALLSLLGMGDALQESMAALRRLEEGGWSAIGWREGLILAGVWTCWIWIFCLQCAGAVLFFLRGGDGTDAAPRAVRPEAPPASHMAPQDLRALRKSRSQLG
ncbi:hypothetical protein ROTO_05500 [Roseovarius tolerans]|uniref:Uncharacterized protein n=1 Tax=Roseovarius tolerans TaxID=74031 RepID=A0A0L6CZM8_9RHOB|nr:hypothetical protein ROTO_05500 [Roseovarius tolerans]